MARFKSLLPIILIISCILTITHGKAINQEEEVREKRDVLKGKDHDFLKRSKRYIGRVPVAYMKKVVQQPYNEEEDEQSEFASGRQPGLSHFREFQMRQGGPSHYQRFPEDEDPVTNNLSDDEIQTLLLLLDGYELEKGPPPPRSNKLRPSDLLSQANLDRLAQSVYAAQNKRETGKRNYGRNYDEGNFYGGEPDRLEFLTEGRPKRIGARNLMKPSSRVKKETTLDRAFSEDVEQPKAKKDVDWSNYFGLDKRAAVNHPIPVAKGQLESQPEVSSKPPTAAASTKPTKLAKSKTPVSKPGSKNDLEERKENETTNKDRPDKDWLLQEFYKNFAMMTNVKRKRESPALASNDLDKLEELEQQMTQVGDKIIWDAVKFTGAHRDQELSPQQLALVKQNIVDKLATAYSLEKVREAVDELRHKLGALEKEQPQM